ncbi:MAG: hypothetical protein IAB19_08740 [Proteobacteria bacterium]|uniref:Uncharacterized protein n=1 Tax=Candidatus Avisuccinivibrio stercorigallinarum TaxID=2840704 RepID=A0A9D9GR51_9GAMM|nr:hypothetical protein [Candidatus Avisuccinivibrio stercorigallinarum]
MDLQHEAIAVMIINYPNHALVKKYLKKKGNLKKQEEIKARKAAAPAPAQ